MLCNHIFSPSRWDHVCMCLLLVCVNKNVLQVVSCETRVVGGVMIAVHFMEKRRCECLCADTCVN